MISVLLNFLAQLIYFVGIIFLFGYVISLINRFFYKLLYGKQAVIYVTGFIGTPIHELSHALMCLIFGHKITEMKLFQINDDDGVLGYVNHTYNRKNIYQLIGNYFIGIAPIVCGSLVLLLLMKLLIPSAYTDMSRQLSEFVSIQAGGFSLNWFVRMLGMLLDVSQVLFVGIFSSGKGIIFLVLAICISLHMNLSGADIKGSLGALPLLAILLLALNAALGIVGFAIPSAYSAFSGFMNYSGSYLSGILFVSLILSGVCLCVAALLRLAIGAVMKLFGR